MSAFSSFSDEEQISFERGFYATVDGQNIAIHDLYDDNLEYSFTLKEPARKAIVITYPYEKLADGILVQFNSGALALFNFTDSDEGHSISLPLEMRANTIHRAFIEQNTLLIEMKNPWFQSAPYIVVNLSSNEIKSVDPGCPLTNIHLSEGGRFFSGISVSSHPSIFLYHIDNSEIRRITVPNAMIYEQQPLLSIKIRDVFLDRDLLYVLYTKYNGQEIAVNIHDLVAQKIIETVPMNSLLASAEKIRYSLDGSHIEAWKSDNWSYNYNILLKSLVINKAFKGAKIVHQSEGSYVVRFETVEGKGKYFFHAVE